MTDIEWHDPLCMLYENDYCCDDCYRCECYIIKRARADERERILAELDRWIEADPTISRCDPDDVWSYGYGVVAVRVAIAADRWDKL